MRLGVAYYPEHWPRSRWETDARLMQEAGITRVRMGEFAWHRMEPREGQYDFAWLQEAIELLGKHGIKTILGTATPAYPAWLHRKFPDIHQIRSDGRVLEFGRRQDACKNHPGYRWHALRIVEEMARCLGTHPDVVAWQVDNELGCHNTVRCYCDNCAAAFRTWLRARFKGDVQALNAAWGTFFWSQSYNDFEEICPPRDCGEQPGNDCQNPGLVLDFYRFSSDVQVSFLRQQMEILRRLSPGRLITHNFMGAFTHIVYFELCSDLDVVSWDNYPYAANGANLPPPPLHHDLMRGLKQRNVWVMEQASGQGGWSSFSATPQPGQMRLWAWQAIARGADMVSFFRWRSCRWGREQFWHGILYHHGIPQRRYEETCQLGRELKTISAELDGSVVRSELAVVFDCPTLWSLESQPNVAADFNYRQMLGRYCRMLQSLGVVADAVSLRSDLDRYKVLLVPTLHVCPPWAAAELMRFAEKGGTLILGPRSGVKDEENAVVEQMLPGFLRELAGCHVVEYDAFSAVKGLETRVGDSSGNSWNALALAEVLSPEGQAEPVLWYRAHYYAGQPAAVRNRFGKGMCLYLGTVLDDAGLRALLERVLSESGIQTLNHWLESVEVVRRVKGGQTYAFYLNHSVSSVSVKLPMPGTDLLTGRRLVGEAKIPGFDLLIVKESSY